MEILLQEGVGRAALPFSGPELQASAHLYGSEKLQGLPRRLEGDKLALGRDPYTREEEIRGEKEGETWGLRTKGGK